MATYAELYALRGNTDLRNKITSAIAIQANVVRTEQDTVPNHVNRLKWAKSAFSDPQGMAESMMWGILAANAASTAAQISGATDAAILTAVANLVDVYATG